MLLTTSFNNLSVTGEVLTLDSGQSLGWAHSKSKIFTNRLGNLKLSTSKKKKKKKKLNFCK